MFCVAEMAICSLSVRQLPLFPSDVGFGSNLIIKRLEGGLESMVQRGEGEPCEAGEAGESG